MARNQNSLCDFVTRQTRCHKDHFRTSLNFDQMCSYCTLPLDGSISEVFNVGFLSSGVTRACLNAVGKMPVRRDVHTLFCIHLNANIRIICVFTH